MQRKSILLVGTWAAGTFALVMAAGLPLSLNATDQTTVAASKVAQPTLNSQGIIFSAELVSPATQPSDPQASRPLTIRIRAENATKAMAQSDFDLQVFSSRVPSDPRSRTMSRPESIWQQSGQVALNAGQSKTIDFTTDPIAPNQVATLFISCGKDRVALLSVSTAVNLSVASK